MNAKRISALNALSLSPVAALYRIDCTAAEAGRAAAYLAANGQWVAVDPMPEDGAALIVKEPHLGEYALRACQ